MKSSTPVALACGLLLSLALGCGGGGSDRYELSGTVTYDGKPVPGGQAIFTPDASQGNAGPGSVAMIKHGRYETFANKGTVGGPHNVTVIGYSDVPGTVPESELQELFPPAQLKLDLPKTSGTLDIQVP